MQLGIRIKFIGILVIAAVVPLVIALIAVYFLGYRYYRREKGVLFQEAATHLAQGVNLVISTEIQKLNNWLLLSDLPARFRQLDPALHNLTNKEFQARVAAIESRWTALTPQDEPLRSILANDIAQRLHAFQSLNPLFAEIFVTDIKGQLVAATNKTTDYWQADEPWWQNALRATAGHACVEGVHFDESARVYSIDVALPLRQFNPPDQKPLGVLKGVINASPLFSAVPRILEEDNLARQIVEEDGYILFEMFGQTLTPMQKRLSSTILQRLRSNRPGWMVAQLDGHSHQLIGYAPIQLSGWTADEIQRSGMRPLYVIVHKNAAEVLAPIHRQLWMLGGIGSMLLLSFTLAGLYIANRKIIGPIELLRLAAQTVSASAKLEQPPGASEPGRPHAGMLIESERVLDRVKEIHTSDEIEHLARDIGSMAKRVLSYHQQLEAEIQTKTAEIQRDLQFAREFQEALMPRKYPEVPSQHVRDPLSLNFHHVYKPASSVGGDFFDVLKLSDHQAGIFIADVMGHGARSALVTAILRTLLQDFSRQADDPARFLSLINRHFFELVQHSNQLIFVSAFYLLVDTQKEIATYASAGHPAPVLADRARRTVGSLIPHLQNNPALGLFRDCTYTSFTSFIKKDDIFLLFTDGIFEAGNPEGEQFGRKRLSDTIEKNLDSDLPALTGAIIEAVNEFIRPEPLPDDICIVAVEVAASPKTPAPIPAQTPSRT